MAENDEKKTTSKTTKKSVNLKQKYLQKHHLKIKKM